MCAYFSKTKQKVSPYVGIHILHGAQIETVDSYEYLGFWLHSTLSFKTRVDNLAQKLRINLGFLCKNKACLSPANRKTIIQSTVLSVFDYGDIIYGHAAATTLIPLDAVYHSALRFITGDGYRTHHCLLYDKVGWLSLTKRREWHCILFIYKALIMKLPPYLSTLITLKVNNYSTRSDYLILDTTCKKKQVWSILF